jgi:pilus assembly protein TadC
VSSRERGSEEYRPGLLAVIAVVFGGLAILFFFLAELGLVPFPDDRRIGLVLPALVLVGIAAELTIAYRSRNNPSDDD